MYQPFTTFTYTVFCFLTMLFFAGSGKGQHQPLGGFAELIAQEFLATHQASLSDLYPSLGEGLFMRYPPPQGPAFEKPVQLQLTIQSIGEDAQLTSWRQLLKLMTAKGAEVKRSSPFPLEQVGEERRILPFGKLPQPQMLRKRPGRAKFQITGIVTDATSFERNERFRRDSQFVIRCEVTFEEGKSIAPPVFIGFLIE